MKVAVLLLGLKGQREEAVLRPGAVVEGYV